MVLPRQLPAGIGSAEYPSPLGTVTRPPLTRFAWLSIATAVVTISLKATGYFPTGSVGLLSDALESIVNLVAAVAALVALIFAAQPADEDHAYGHSKAEYFSSGFDGGLVVLAAASIVAVAVPRLLHPEPLADAALGLAISTPGSLLNGVVAWRLMRAGKQYQSITLEADGRHLLTDVWTSIGVLVGVAAVAITGVDRLDPVIALLVAANIVWTGVGLVRRSMLGLLDTALPPEQRDAVQAVLTRYERQDGIRTHALRTRQAEARAFEAVDRTGERHGIVTRVARQLGIGATSLRNCVRQAEVDRGERRGTTTEDVQRVAALTVELGPANILSTIVMPGMVLTRENRERLPDGHKGGVKEHTSMPRLSAPEDVSNPIVYGVTGQSRDHRRGRESPG